MKQTLLLLLLTLFAAPAHAAAKTRVWIDTDPACGLGAMSDPDDCFALLYLLAHPDLEIAGISTTFGNAPLEATTAVARTLLQRTGSRVKLHPGAARAMGRRNTPATTASEAIARAAAQGPLTIVALGPLTNLATALEGRPSLSIVRVVAVMGKEPGEIFHPAEGSPNAAFGHGPIFTDLNFAKDPRAAQRVLDTGVAITLVPYAAGRTESITRADLATLAARSPAAAWVAGSAQGWLAFWRDMIGRDGFYPFDLVAAIVAANPASATCHTQPAVIRPDHKIGWFGGGPTSLLFTSEPGAQPVTVCRSLSITAVNALDAALTKQAAP